MRWTLASFVMVVMAAGCGAKVTVDLGSSGTTGAGGGSTGDSTSTGIVTQICGGKQGLQCAPSQWCQWDSPGSCGNFDGSGICQPRPEGCPTDCPGECGCDGQFYCNACGANTAGTDVSGNGSCGVVEDAGPPPDAEYAAYQLFTNIPRYAIARTELSASRCTWIIMAGDSGAGFGIQATMGWNVENVFVTPDVADCMGSPGNFPMPSGASVNADGGGGSIKQDNATFPCFVDVHVKLSFPPVAPWVPATEVLDTDHLVIQGDGCGG